MTNHKWQSLLQPQQKRWKRRLAATELWTVSTLLFASTGILFFFNFNTGLLSTLSVFAVLLALCAVDFGFMVLRENFLSKLQVFTLQMSIGIGGCSVLLAMFLVRV